MMEQKIDICGMQPPTVFPAALSRLGPRPLIACHNDADGLSAGVILRQALQKEGLSPVVRIVGKGENAYANEFRGELEPKHASGDITGLIIADLGVSAELPVKSLPTVIIDHHIPKGLPQDATVISGINDDPIPTSSLLAFRAARELGGSPAVWLAAIGIIGDMAEGSGFTEMEEARAFGITALRKAASLVNAPRRSASGDATPAFELLAKAQSPKQVISGELAETAILIAAKDEVRREVERARQTPPKLSGPVALILFSSPCQVHPLVAQTWSGRLKTSIVFAANSGYRPGWVHFAARSSQDVDIPAFLAKVRPPGAEEKFGNGHKAASGGALRIKDWNIFVRMLGFSADMEIAATAGASS